MESYITLSEASKNGGFVNVGYTHGVQKDGLQVLRNLQELGRFLKIH